MFSLVLVIVTVSAALTVMISSSTSTCRLANRARSAGAARFLAEGGLAAAQRELLAALSARRAPPASGACVIGGTPVAWSIDPAGLETVDTGATGVRTTRTRYRLASRTEVLGAEERAHRMVDALGQPIFQFAVFYDGDLEIYPGPDMTLRGRIHTNGDLYLSCGGKLTLDSNHVRAVGDLFRHRKDDPGRSQGAVFVREWVANPFDPAEPARFRALLGQEEMQALGLDTKSGYDSAFTAGYDADGDGKLSGRVDWLPFALGALQYWNEPDGYARGTGATLLTSAHGLTAAVAPGVRSIAAYEPAPEGGDRELDRSSGAFVAVAPGKGTWREGFFHARAGLALVAKDGRWSARDANGLDVGAALAGVVTLARVFDARQGGTIDVIQVDLAALNDSGVFPANGLLYACTLGNGTGTDMKGVRLVDGNELAAPLTVVSDGAVYVQGDYNTIARKGAAVIADAVNLLSNAWDDSKDSSRLPRARATTYNLAFISGNHPSAVGVYNGGFENLLRLHEDWNGIACNVTGSFVDLWESVHATGTWAYGGNRYMAPVRNFAFDEGFDDEARLPPFTPLVFTAEDVVSW